MGLRLIQQWWKEYFWHVIDIVGSIVLICAVIGGMLRFIEFVQWEYARLMFWLKVW